MAAYIPAKRFSKKGFGLSPAVMTSVVASVVAVSGLALSGCSTIKTSSARGKETIKTSNVMPVAGSKTNRGSGGVLLAVEFMSAEKAGLSESGCRLRLLNTDKKSTTFLTVKPGEPGAFARLEPGNYETLRMGCGLTSVWDLADTFKSGFRVEDGAVSYLGKLVFAFKGKELDVVKKASRTASAEAFLAARTIVPSEGMDFISGFTGRRIDEKFVRGGDLRDGFDVFGKGVANGVDSLDPLLSSLKVCTGREGGNDPLRFGRLEYIALYRDGRFSEMKERKEANAFSDELRTCVERSMMAFHPKAKGDVEVSVKY